VGMKWSARALPSGTIAFHGLVEPALAARYMRAADASLLPWTLNRPRVSSCRGTRFDCCAVGAP
jgi:hypothetical protein